MQATVIIECIDHSTDNAAMIGWASMHRFLAGECDDFSLHHRRTWDLEELNS